MPSRPGFQVTKPKEEAMAGEENAKNRGVLSKPLECERIANGFDSNIFPNFTTQSWIPGTTKNHVKDARDCLLVSLKPNRTNILQHACHQMRIGWRKKMTFEMALTENPNTETQMPN
jgi:hypothetical protein